MSKVDEIKNQLAQRLEKQSARALVETDKPFHPLADPPATELPINKRKSKTESGPANQKNKTPKVRVTATSSEGVIKVSASLYNYDIDCLDRIREFMRRRGVRNLTDSEALRLACRAVKIDDQLLAIYEGMSKEDGRRRKV